MDKESTRKQLLAHPLVKRLLNNPNWEPAARAAIENFVEGKDCPVQSWRRSSTWQQVQVAFQEITEGSRVT